jgi:two-component system, chemotaxis family, CheB/CheR fusion protein
MNVSLGGLSPVWGKMVKRATRRKERPALSGKASVTRASAQNDLLIAAIGASAGGIEAFTELLRALPTDTGMAFVLIQHLDPKHHSMLAELLSKETTMPVREVTDGMRVEGNNVYVIPPNATMSISDHRLQLVPRGVGVHMSIDHFMRSLAEAQGNCAIGVILSGVGSDGTLGMAEIQAQGGVTFAQDETTAKNSGMPRSVSTAGYADYVLPPKGISRELARISHHPYVARGAAAEVELVPSENTGLSAIFGLVRRNTGVDFTHYRQTTILRRIHRRMVVHKIDKIEDYLKYLRTNTAEIKALYQDMLINVTSFFRNPAVFDTLKSQVFPKILKSHAKDSAIRAWTPGCASGEETYSLAIALLEFLGDRTSEVPIQLFGTDVSETSISRARSGLYPQNIEGDVSADRLRRFFTKVDNGYRVSKSIRDMCIFAQHNLLSDPPFSQMDIICCRNLLIYLEPSLQNRVISLFHYAARPDGYVVLGTSEGVGISTNLFATEDRVLKIFQKRPAGRQLVTFSLNRSFERSEYGPIRLPAKPPDSGWGYVEAQKEFDRRLLTQFAPATAFINEELEIVHTRGNINRYLKLAPGRASLNILKMGREGLALELRNALNRAKKDRAPVRKQGIQVRIGNGNGDEGRSADSRSVNFEVIPLTINSLKETYFMVIFQETPAHRGPGARQEPSLKRKKQEQAEAGQLAKLEQELAATKEYLQSVIETQEATNEELQSANEEILSSNEELQSTNEELETAKEELQSANEELSTVNDELRNRNSEVSQINNDLTNLLTSTDMAIVMVSSDLTIRRFTPQAQKIFGLIPSDVGRPFMNINPAIDIPEFQPMVFHVMSNFDVIEKDLSDHDSAHYRLRIAPYRASDDKIEGAVITVVELSRQASGMTSATPPS